MGLLRIPRRVVVVAFILALAASLLFAVRATIHAVYWASHREDPIEPWMTIGYVAHSYGVPPPALREALGLPAGRPDRRPLGEVAAELGLTMDEMRAALAAAIARTRPPESAPPPPAGPGRPP